MACCLRAWFLIALAAAEGEQVESQEGLCHWSDVQRRGWVWNSIDLSRCTVLDFSKASLKDDDVAALAAAFDTSLEIAALDLGGNGIGDTGAGAIATMLKYNWHLTALNLSHNRIGDDGTVAIAESLLRKGMANSLWKSLFRGGLAGYWEARTFNQVLTTLDLSGNLASDRVVDAWADVLRSGTQLAWLLLTGNSITVDGASALAEVVNQTESSISIEVLTASSDSRTGDSADQPSSTSMQDTHLALELSETKARLQAVEAELEATQAQLKEAVATLAEKDNAGLPIFKTLGIFILACCICFPLAACLGIGSGESRRLLEESRSRESELQRQVAALEEQQKNNDEESERRKADGQKRTEAFKKRTEEVKQRGVQ